MLLNARMVLGEPRVINRRKIRSFEYELNMDSPLESQTIPPGPTVSIRKKVEPSVLVEQTTHDSVPIVLDAGTHDSVHAVRDTEIHDSIPVGRDTETRDSVQNTAPRLLKHVDFKYSPFVIPPPIRIPSMKGPELKKVSEYYKTLLRASVGCRDDICLNPVKYLNQFGDWSCSKTPNVCDKSSMLVMAEKKYLVGSLDVIENGYISRSLDCGWPADHSKCLVEPRGWKGPLFNATVVYLTVPEGLSFQHFLDGVVPKLVQLQEIIRTEKDAIYVMDHSVFDMMPRKLLMRLGIQQSQLRSILNVPWKNNYMHVKKLILACQVPPLHPQLWRQAQEMFRLPWLNPEWKQTRHIVLYLSRNQGTRNSGRQVVNEADLLSSIRSIVEKKKYELIVFNSKEYDSLDGLFSFLANVDVIMGPHGGAFYNMLFMRRGTTAIEFTPTTPSFHSLRYAVHMIVYLQAALLGNQYYNVMTNAVSDNMEVDVDEVVSILQSCL